MWVTGNIENGKLRTEGADAFSVPVLEMDLLKVLTNGARKGLKMRFDLLFLILCSLCLLKH